MKFIITVCFFLLVGPGRHSAEAQPRSGGTLSYCETVFPKTFDPVTGNEDMAKIRMTTLLFEGLIGIDMNRDCWNQLAEKPIFSSDRKQVDVRLRQGIKWSDGGELTAGDVVATVEAMKKSGNASILSSLADVASVLSVDTYTVRILFKRKMTNNQEILRRLTFKILPKHKLGNLPLTPKSDIALNPVGTGFYRLANVEINKAIMTRNDHYKNRRGNWEGPYIDSIVMYDISAPETQIEHLIDQRVDIVVEVPPTSIPNLEAAGLLTVAYESLSIEFIGFNQNTALLKNVAIRRAMTHGFNRFNLLQKVYQSKGMVIPGPFSPSSPSYARDILPLPYDVSIAESLLVGAGFDSVDRDGVRYNAKGEKLEFQFVTPRYPAGNSYSTRVFNQFSSDMKRIGIHLISRDLALDSFFTTVLRDHDFDLAFGQFVFREGGYVAPLFRKGNNHPGEENFISYNNPEVERLLDLWDASAKPEEMKNITGELTKVLRDDCPYLFLWSLTKTAAARSRVRNFVNTVTPFSFFDYANRWYIEE